MNERSPHCDGLSGLPVNCIKRPSSHNSLWECFVYIPTFTACASVRDRPVSGVRGRAHYIKFKKKLESSRELQMRIFSLLRWIQARHGDTDTLRHRLNPDRFIRLAKVKWPWLKLIARRCPVKRKRNSSLETGCTEPPPTHTATLRYCNPQHSANEFVWVSCNSLVFRCQCFHNRPPALWVKEFLWQLQEFLFLKPLLNMEMVFIYGKRYGGLGKKPGTNLTSCYVVWKSNISIAICYYSELFWNITQWDNDDRYTNRCNHICFSSLFRVWMWSDGKAQIMKAVNHQSCA